METTATIVGQGRFRYAIDKGWGRGPGGVPEFGLVSGVAVDSRDRVYVFQRTPTAEVLVFDPEGRLLTRWGESLFRSPHGIWIGPDDRLYLTDTGLHQVLCCTAEGELLNAIGTAGQPGPPGAPFNQPTYAVLAPDGELYVSDGYGQNRVHRFDAGDRLIRSWGETGTGPGQFGLPHDICLDPRDRLLVCDRPNNRVQLFDRGGDYLGEWTDFAAPQQIRPIGDLLFCAEAGSRVTIRTLDNAIVSGWGGQGPADDQFTHAPHAIWADSRGDLYVGEVPAPNKIQKCRRVVDAAEAAPQPR